MLLVTVSVSIRAATPEREKAFTDEYKAAMEGNDTATLESFLYTQGSDPAIVGCYKMMQSGEAGETISSSELVNLTPEDAKKAATPMDSPTGGKVCLPLKPTKKVVIKIEKRTPTAALQAAARTLSRRKTANSSSPSPARLSSAPRLHAHSAAGGSDIVSRPVPQLVTSIAKSPSLSQCAKVIRQHAG